MFVNNLEDDLAQTGQNIISSTWDKVSNFISGNVDNVIPGTNPPQPTSPATESPTYVPPPDTIVGVSTAKQINPLLLGVVAAGVIWFATHKPLFAGLAGAGGYFFTDKVINKGA